MAVKIDAMVVEMQPSITKYGFEDLGDDPDKHRWRAWWASEGGFVHGIELRAYPVIQKNPASVWINEDGYLEATKQPWEGGAPAREWVPFDEQWMRKRLLYNATNAAWAKPTQEEAIRSLAIRLCRWTARIHRDMKRAESAVAVLEKLRPDLPAFTETARRNLAHGAPRSYVEDY